MEAQREEAREGNKMKNPIVFVRVTAPELTLLLDSIGEKKLYDLVMKTRDSVTTIVQTYKDQKDEVDKILNVEAEKMQKVKQAIGIAMKKRSKIAQQ